MKVTAFAHSHGERAGEQADASREDMQNQEREPHCSHPYRLPPMPVAVKTDRRAAGLQFEPLWRAPSRRAGINFTVCRGRDIGAPYSLELT